MVSSDEKLEITRGDTKVFPFTLTDAATAAAKDLTGYLLWFTVKKSYADSDAAAVVWRRVNEGIEIKNQTTHKGQIEVTVPGFATSGLLNTFHTFPFDVQSKDPAGNIVTERRGTFLVLPGVTDATIHG